MRKRVFYSASPLAAGFTLVELMISIAIVLILMLGINFVFSTSAKTISGGMALTGVSREIRGARRVMEADFSNAVTAKKMPALIIHNEAIYAWRDKQDKLADIDQYPWTYDVDGEQSTGDEILMEPAALTPPTLPSPLAAPAANYPGLYNFRRHRIDRIAYFTENATSEYIRQTGDSNTYIASQSQMTPEAWIRYGLLRIPDNANDGAPDYWKPGGRGAYLGGVYQDEQGNPNNFFASQWILGRTVILLKDESSLPLNATFLPAPWLQFGTTAQQVTQITPFTSAPFNRESPNPPNPYAGATPWRVEESRIDLAGTTIKELRESFRLTPPTVTWWDDADPTMIAAAANRDSRVYSDIPPAPPVSFNYLAWAKPFLDKTLNSSGSFATSMANQTREAALTTPVFVKGCTQFIVEFAGDFYDQGPSGTPAAPEKLGRIDFENAGPGPGAGVRTRWYGAPRDIDGDGTMDVQPVSVPPVATGTTPLRRWDTSPPAPPAPPNTVVVAPPFESVPAGGTKIIYAWGPTESTGRPIPTAGTSATTPPPGWTTFPGYGKPGDANSVRPSLIRITMQLIDANGRLADGPSVEYVFPIPSTTDE
jgi:prepilin-type N-terminal cleavage/methylation domain-containing protein